MIPVNEAEEILKTHQLPLKVEEVPLSQCLGKVLQEDLKADRDFPPYHRVTMDGIAINFKPYEAGQRKFEIENVAPAGKPQTQLSSEDKCIEVMTGAILPNGTDTVIRYEDIATKEGAVTIEVAEVLKGQNIHYQGEDRKSGEVLITKGRIISPAEIGVCATIGKHVLKVAALPKAIVISSGDELVEINETPMAHQIRKSNVYRLAASLEKLGVNTATTHLKDDFEAIKVKLGDILENYEIVILSGGVSKGKFDFMPKALEALGVVKHFHKIKQRPGKPFWFGQKDKNRFVFAFPGNPVSSFMCMQKYFMPWLVSSLGATTQQTTRAMLSEDISFKPDLTYYLQVALSYEPDGKVMAIPYEGNGSGDLANLVYADGFLELPQGKDTYKRGEVFNFIPFR